MTDEEIIEENLRQEFVAAAMPSKWLDISEEMISAAEVLYKREGGAIRVEAQGQSTGEAELRRVSAVSRPYMLLCGFAIENVLKGLLVAEDSSLITGGRLKQQLKTHKLVNLAKRISGVDLSSTEEEMLEILQAAIPYWGRYPVPLQKSEVAPDVALTAERREILVGLQYRLGKRLYDQIKGGWDSGTGARSYKLWSKKYDPDGSPDLPEGG